MPAFRIDDASSRIVEMSENVEVIDSHIVDASLSKGRLNKVDPVAVEGEGGGVEKVIEGIPMRCNSHLSSAK